ncbi:hypothetical protein Poly24_19150 [Rosistilla carotiformis]|uniref:Uncharacterized protein n=1 Tax=Rosistilla carotiformis TaxID=2528017 RepID=A0A518JRR6_9BACT|nr:hypothetical protein [Rosistilla carotiformis]QDV68206.1 hypothetical protein Poly24_19150 [Rosistilla carotiformis]
MMGDHDFVDADPGDPPAIEAIIRSAGEYVVVSDDLRPRTIEAAMDRQGLAATRRRVRWAALGAALFLAVSIPWIRSYDGGGLHSVSPTTAEIHQAALRYAAEANISPDWALQKVLDDLRRSQAERLGQSMR